MSSSSSAQAVLAAFEGHRAALDAHVRPPLLLQATRTPADAQLPRPRLLLAQGLTLRSFADWPQYDKRDRLNQVRRCYHLGGIAFLQRLRA
jgi:hypothetical protein